VFRFPFVATEILTSSIKLSEQMASIIIPKEEEKAVPQKIEEPK
jgi:hypothetical protein